jgi:hypothetical protein
MRALLTRAAMVECERQTARERRDWPKLSQCKSELRRLWARHAALERQVV